MPGPRPAGLGQNPSPELEPLADQQLRFRCTTGRPNISLSSFHIKVGTGAGRILKGEVPRCGCLVRVEDLRGVSTQKRGEGRQKEGLEDIRGPGDLVSLRNSCVPPRTALPWPPSSCRPVSSHPFRPPWRPQSPQTAPCNCSSSAMAASSAATATPPALELWAPARGGAWPPLSSLQEQVRGMMNSGYQVPNEIPPKCLSWAPSSCSSSPTSAP